MTKKMEGKGSTVNVRVIMLSFKRELAVKPCPTNMVDTSRLSAFFMKLDWQNPKIFHGEF